MVKIKVTYFNMKGKAEVIRWVLAFAGQEFEDERIERENWPEYKPKMLTGQVPQIEYDGVSMAQSMAIVRFLAREFGLSGKTNMESFKADMATECVTDLFNQGAKMRNEPDETKKAEILKNIKDVVVPNFWKIITKMLEESGGQFVAGNEATYGDIVLSVCVDFMLSHMQFPAEAIPKPVMEIKKAIEANEGVKKYLETRPKTEF